MTFLDEVEKLNTYNRQIYFALIDIKKENIQLRDFIKQYCFIKEIDSNIDNIDMCKKTYYDNIIKCSSQIQYEFNQSYYNKELLKEFIDGEKGLISSKYINKMNFFVYTLLIDTYSDTILLSKEIGEIFKKLNLILNSTIDIINEEINDELIR